MSGARHAATSGARRRNCRPPPGSALAVAVSTFLLALLPCCPPAARASALAARRAAPALPPRQQALIARVDSLWLADAREEAHALVRERLPGARAEADSLLLAHLLARQGQMWAAVNQAQAALPVLREALGLAETLRVEELRRACRRWLGVALYGQGRLAEGVAQFAELLDLARAAGDARHEGYAWMGLAYHDWRTNRFEPARQEYQRAVDLLRGAGDLRGELWALIGLNIAHAHLGDYPRALAGNRRIVEIGRNARMLGAEALGHNNLGALLYSLGDPGEALAHFQLAQQLMQQEGDLRESIVAGRNIAICEIALGRTQAALDRLPALLDQSRQQGYHDLEAGLLSRLADAYHQLGLVALAARLHRQALALGGRLSLKEECDSLLGLARALAALDSSAAALAILRQGAPRILSRAAPLDQCRFRVGLARRLLDQGLAAEALATLAPVEERGRALGLAGVRLDALPLAARAARALGRPDTALALLQRARRLWESDRGLPLDPEWREQRGAAACDLFSQLTALVLEHPSQRPLAERTREAFAILQAYKARTLLERMRGPGGAAGPEGNGSAEAGAAARGSAPAGIGPAGQAATDGAPVTLEQLQSRVLGPDELFLDVLHGPERTLTFACTREECRVAFAPGGEELAGRLRLQHELLAAPPPAGAAGAACRTMAWQASRELATLLLGPFDDLLARKRRLILAPDGALNLTSLAALLAPAGADTAAAGGAPSGATPLLSRVPSAAVLARLREPVAPARATAGRILALAGPITPENALPGTRREVAWLARRFAGVDRRPPAWADTGTAWQSGLSPYAVLHFAMHSATDDRSPWRSAIRVGTAGPDGQARTVTAAEIAACQWPARLVVLSCCESASGRILSGEGVQSLASAFLAAGARAVLATLWTVDDAVAARFMGFFYDALAAGDDAASALRRAQATVRADPRTSHPFYWAGFVLVGDGSLRLDLAPHGRPWWHWAATALCLIAIGGGLMSAGRRRREGS